LKYKKTTSKAYERKAYEACSKYQELQDKINQLNNKLKNYNAKLNEISNKLEFKKIYLKATEDSIDNLEDLEDYSLVKDIVRQKRVHPKGSARLVVSINRYSNPSNKK
jgi:chromosome segregation ATPase